MSQPPRDQLLFADLRLPASPTDTREFVLHFEIGKERSCRRRRHRLWL